MKHVIAALGLAVLMALPAGAAVLGDDGLHKTAWMRETFKDLRDDLAEANAEGKRLMVIVEQRGCIYCTKMHEEVFPIEDIAQTLNDEFFVIQINMFGDVEVVDFDGEAMSEKDAIRRWNVMFTPTMMFFPEDVPENVTAAEAAAVIMPGAFEAGTTRNMLRWVLEEGYLSDENFQKYHARMLEQQRQD